MASNRKRGHRYRLITSLSAGVLLVLVLAYIGHEHHDPMPVAGGAFAAVAIGLVMFVIWSIIAMFRRGGQRARERERTTARPAGRRGRRYGYDGR